MNPFENAANFVHAFAENMYTSYAMLKCIPVLEGLQLQAVAAEKQQDYALIAQLAVTEALLQQQISVLSHDA